MLGFCCPAYAVGREGFQGPCALFECLDFGEVESGRGQQGRGDAVVLFCPLRTGLAPMTTVSWTYRKAGRATALMGALQLQAFSCTRFQGPEP